MRKSLAVLAATIGLIGVAPAAAQATTRYDAAYASMLRTCQGYQGCHGLTLITYSGNPSGTCYTYLFRFYTTYVGTKYYWSGDYCSPPWQR